MDRKAMQAAAHDYPYLRGLLSVPGGVLFLLAALGNAQWGPFRHTWVFLVALAALLASAWAAHRYYEHHYGRVTPTARNSNKAGALLGAAVVVGLLATFLLRSQASWSLDLPINPMPVVYGAITLVYYGVFVGLKPHHLAIWGTLLLAGALPVWTGDDPSNIALVMIGAATIVNGVFDHLELTRTLAAARVGG